jgi:hypothetical protein
MHSTGQRIEEEEKVLEVESSRINIAQERLATKRSLIDPTNHDEVDAFNAAINEHNEQLRVFRLRVEKYDSAIGSYNDGVREFNALCGEKKYYVDDMNAIVREFSQ